MSTPWEEILPYFDDQDKKDIQQYIFEALLQEGKNKRLSGRSLRRFVTKRMEKRTKREMIRLINKI